MTPRYSPPFKLMLIKHTISIDFYPPSDDQLIHPPRRCIAAHIFTITLDLPCSLIQR